jgi:hypothetical protein
MTSYKWLKEAKMGGGGGGMEGGTIWDIQEVGRMQNTSKVLFYGGERLW